MITTEIDALANMMAADSNRIDGLVNDVGVVKGRVEHIHHGVDELRSALAILVRHETLMTQYETKHHNTSTRLDTLDTRIHEIEKKLPPLEEARGWTVKGILAVIAVVGMAILALVIKNG